MGDGDDPLKIFKNWREKVFWFQFAVTVTGRFFDVRGDKADSQVSSS
jgi:hypothetical protein